MRAVHTKSTGESLKTIEQKLQGPEPVFFTRFGDGDVYLMRGDDANNHQYSEELSKELIDAFTIDHPHYLIGLAANYPHEEGMASGLFSPHECNDSLVEYIQKNIDLLPPEGYESAILFHYLAIFKPEIFNQFIQKHVVGKSKMYIGCLPKETIEKIYGPIDYHVLTPAKNAYSSIANWWPEVEKNIDKTQVVLPAAGSATKVINKRLWNMNAQVNSFDIGSVIDAIDGWQSRKWIKLKGHKVNKVLLPEFQDTSVAFRIKSSLLDIKYDLRSYFYSIKNGIK